MPPIWERQHNWSWPTKRKAIVALPPCEIVNSVAGQAEPTPPGVHPLLTFLERNLRVHNLPHATVNNAQKKGNYRVPCIHFIALGNARWRQNPRLLV